MDYIFWVPQGRFGNLLFQYQAACFLTAKNSKIFTLNLGIASIIELDSRVYCLDIPQYSRLGNIFNRLARYLAFLKIVGIISLERKEVVPGFFDETDKVIRRPGLFKFLWVIDGYFQTEQFTLKCPQIKPIPLEIVKKKITTYPALKKVAVHIRAHDYSDVVYLGKVGAKLPSAFYDEAMSRLRTVMPDISFLVFSDDYIEAKKMLGNSSDVFYFQGETLYEDFVAMSLCDHAIISPSTFAWWAAYLIKRKDGLVLAPKFWTGFKSNIWFPKFIETQKFEYLDVSSC